jgi:archaemetzincin
VLEELRKSLEQTFACLVEFEPGMDEFGPSYDQRRKQYLSPLLLRRLGNAEEGERVLGIADVDLYAPGLNFVFGEADLDSRIAIISLHRLRQECYGLPPHEALFRERAIKEAIHELGHTSGLGHCPDRECVMHFSHSLPDTDLKKASFCVSCQPKLKVTS